MESQTNITIEQKKPEPKRAAVNSLAVVGFIALVLIGITLAIYAARYIPSAVSQLASAGSAFTTKSGSSTPASLSVVSGTTSIPFSGEPSSDTSLSAQNTTAMEPSAPAMVAPAPTPTHSVSEHVASAPYGLPDLKMSGIVTGYLADGSNDSFVAAEVIPAGARAAVRFTVSNAGTNVTGPWGFIAQLPETNGYTFTSPVEQNLNPGDHILFTLGFDQVQIAPGPQPVTVQVDPNNQISESNEVNNSASSAFVVAN